MSTWDVPMLERIAAAEEVQVAPRQDDGSLGRAITVWIVRDGDDLYVRSWRGAAGSWWNTARATHAGHITAGGAEADVTFAPAGDAGVNDRLDAAYRAKYGRHSSYVEPMVAEQARATTLRLTPQP